MSISNMNFLERILYLLQRYGVSYLKGAGTTLAIALVSDVYKRQEIKRRETH